MIGLTAHIRSSEETYERAVEDAMNAQDMRSAQAAMAVTGFGGASIWIPAPAVTSSLVPERQRSLAIGAVGAGIGIGFITAGWVARSIGEEWRALYRVETLVGIVTAIALWLFLRVPVEADARRPSLRSLGAVPRWRHVLVSYGSYGLSMSLFVNFFVARLEEDSGVPPTTTALIFATFGIASIFGGPMFGSLSDSIGRNRALILGFGAMATSSLVLLMGFGVWPWLAALVAYLPRRRPISATTSPHVSSVPLLVSSLSPLVPVSSWRRRSVVSSPTSFRHSLRSSSLLL